MMTAVDPIDEPEVDEDEEPVWETELFHYACFELEGRYPHTSGDAVIALASDLVRIVTLSVEKFLASPMVAVICAGHTGPEK